MRAIAVDSDVRALSMDWLEGLRPFFGTGVPLLLNGDGSPSLAPPGHLDSRVFIVSIPKSGTYLLGEILKVAGWIPTNCHMTGNGFTDYRYRTREEKLHQPRDLWVACPLRLSLGLVHNGQFSVGHLRCIPANVDLLKDFRCLFTYRECRAALVSRMRFMRNKGRAENRDTSWKEIEDDRGRMAAFMDIHGPTAMENIGSIATWRASGEVYPVSFETLVGDDGDERRLEVLQNMFAWLGVERTRQDIHNIVGRAIGSSTLTWSGARTSVNNYWNDRCEEIFVELHGPQMNSGLGYSQ